MQIHRKRSNTKDLKDFQMSGKMNMLRKEEKSDHCTTWHSQCNHLQCPEKERNHWCIGYWCNTQTSNRLANQNKSS